MSAFLNDLRYCRDGDEEYAQFDWSVWDYDKIKEGDEFYWVKVGLGQTGIVGHGRITSDPYEGKDWSGKDRKTFYVNFSPDVLINPDALALITCQQLSVAIPDFEWHKGHSGLVLNDDQAEKLNSVWHDYLETNKTEFLGKSIGYNDYVYLEHDLEDVAMEMAEKACEGKTDDLAGNYFEHCKRVADDIDNAGERIVALLQGVIDFSYVTPEQLSKIGFPDNIIEAVISITRLEDERDEDYLLRVSQNKIGRKVKISDLEDQLDISRLDSLPGNCLEHINKCLHAYHYLSSEQDEHSDENAG